MARIIDSGNYAALVAAPETGGTYRNLVSIFARDAENNIDMHYFWNGIGTVSIVLVDPRTGVQTARDFVGDGALNEVDPVVSVQGMLIKTYTIRLSPLHAAVRNMYSGQNIRNARVELHRLQIIPSTNEPAGPAMVEDVGTIDKAPLTLEGVSAESYIDLQVVNRVRAMTKTRSDKKSDAWTRQNRLGDQIRKYNDTANVKIWWGQAKDKAASGGNSTSSGGNDQVTSTPSGVRGRDWSR